MKILNLHAAKDKETEGKHNVNQLTALVEKYIPQNKKFVIKKIRREQEV